MKISIYYIFKDRICFDKLHFLNKIHTRLETKFRWEAFAINYWKTNLSQK